MGPDSLETILQERPPQYFLRRVGAMVVDGLPATGLMYLHYLVVRFTVASLADWTGWVPFLGYFLVGEALWGCTLGKWLFRLRVVDSRGHRPGWVAATRRTLTRFLEANPLFFAILPATLLFLGLPAFLLTYRSPGRQRLGDKWARTYVLTASQAKRLYYTEDALHWR